MVVTPLIRGLLGIETNAGSRELRFAPQLPANWDHVEVRNVAVGNDMYNLSLRKSSGRVTIKLNPCPPRETKKPGTLRFIAAPAFPQDALVRKVTVQGNEVKFAAARLGDIQRVEVNIEVNQRDVEVIYEYDEGTEVYVEREASAPGAQSVGLRVLRSRADAAGLHLLVEGLGGRSYALPVRTPHQLVEIDGVRIKTNPSSDGELIITFAGVGDAYVRREITIPFKR